MIINPNLTCRFQVLPQAFDDEFPAVIQIVTGVPRRSDEVVTVPQIPAATPALAVHEGDDAE